jgi:hypothetical protein
VGDGALGPEPEHGEVHVCECGLHMQAYGNSLTIWLDERVDLGTIIDGLRGHSV